MSLPTALSQVSNWLNDAEEDAHLEFKEAKQQFDHGKLLRYCVAIANEGGGKFVLGVTNQRPRSVVGTDAFRDVQEVQRKILDKLNFRVDVEELHHPDGRLVVFHIPARPSGTAYSVEGSYWMRSGEDLKPMSDDRLRLIHAEGGPGWLECPAIEGLDVASVIALLDTQAFFDLLGMPYPTDQRAAVDRLSSEGLVEITGTGLSISRMGALLFAKRLSDFPLEVARRAVRIVVYDGVNKLVTRVDRSMQRGYAAGFSGLVEYVHDLAPANRLIEESVRRDAKMFPRQAIRELVANAIVHQDFSVPGTCVMVELYADRLEVSNPGKSAISVDRFIDEYRSRNERLADLLRRMGICEEKGSGIDKVVHAAESHQLPAPDFRTSELRTSCIMFAHQDFAAMSKPDRVRACYQHCALSYVSNQRMTNQTLRERFDLPESKAATVSQVISATLETGRIRLDDSETTSRRYAKYLPWWA